MTLGNFLALAQKNIKRMLAYSSIAHAGYILIGVVAFSELGGTSTVYYIIAYIMTNLAAFGAVTAYGRVTGSDEIKSYSGLSRRSPALALVMLVAFLSLGWNAAVRRFCCQSLCLQFSHPISMDLAGGRGCAQFNCRVVLLFDRS